MGIYCDKHKVQKEPSGGRSAHVSNWYCQECDLEKIVDGKIAELQEALGELAKFRREIA